MNSENATPVTIDAAQDSARVKHYHRTGRMLAVAGYLVDLLVLLALLFAGWSLALRNVALHYSARPWLALLIYLGLFGIITQVAGLPLEYLSGFWLEHRFELSNLTLGGWVKDQLKGLAVSGTLGALAAEFLYAVIRHWPERWWMVCAAGFIAFFVLMANLAPVVIFPIFFKVTPLDNPSLTERLLELSRARRHTRKGCLRVEAQREKQEGQCRADGNRQHAPHHSVGYAAGTVQGRRSGGGVGARVWPPRPPPHPSDHRPPKRRHVCGVLPYPAAAGPAGTALQLHGAADFANLPLLALIATGLSLVLLPLVNSYSRAMERQADAYALRSIASSTSFISSMEKLAELNLAERQPHPWIEFVFHSHPSIRKRIAFAERFQA